MTGAPDPVTDVWFKELFADGPDTSCRTTWRDEDVWTATARTQCVEVSMDDLRDAFERAEIAAGGEGA